MQIRLSSFVKKEILHIFRDKRTMLVAILIPVTLILLFGFTVSTDINNIDFAVCAPHRSEAVARGVDKLSFSPYFTFKGYIPQNDIDRTLRTGKASAVLVFAQDYAESGKVQVVVDGADVNAAATSAAYVGNVLQDGGAAQALFEMHVLYNPELRSSYNFIPGILGMILLLICTMMTSVSIVREKETGTMEVLLVSPVKPLYIIISKMVPYLILGAIDLALILVMARFVLGVPLSGGVGGIILVSLVYIVLSLALGLMVSNIAGSQIVALLLSAMVMMLPVLFFSGLLFPVENLPWVFRWISYVIPARWYIDAMRKMMIEGMALSGVILEAGILVVEMLALIAASTKRFNDRLE